ncbi:MAG: antibiotic biosynthesis monooxygenase [Candidatus Thermofonsia Clade 1 bacterium]|jgi:quinol monooxygenase YgiN|uniref:Antibiotic biosynthesis monooxygenase n=1 Tax=Candidatus Thermofonsia Clade 1 bacterium TaxID=2364210 RepID=A0A2M8PZN8_9CHLR|nr:MAG: antibiotic biosynthesis monooxygenase [Candidatus Thermofonsia Clade 1 bacterium]PJF43014.1 MAG: antibiotic biosynthesis monooxygenase [Candidatus Thermofonsia Clade 1 bacterium]RMF49626.1 MAG: antibiotic biosynthesis monooxygenase [Chloroflexota bacterium]
MIVVLVSIHVKPEFVQAFIAATLENARHSVQEAGIARFDFIQQEEEPTRFMLIEVFHSPEAQQAHRETAHYLAWREAVSEMLAEPRVGVRYLPLFPDQALWKYPDA